MSAGGLYRDLAGGALGAAQAQMQIEQMKLQRQQLEQQAAAQRSAQDVARQQVLADILGNTAKGVVGGVAAAQDYQTQQKRLGIEQQQADRQAKLAEAQIAAAELDKQKALADQVQQMARMRLLGQLGLSAQPGSQQTAEQSAQSPVQPSSSLSSLVQPEATSAPSAAAPVPSGVGVKRIESDPTLGLVGQRNAAMARQSMADMVGVSPDLGLVRQDMSKGLGVSTAAAAPEAPAAATPIVEKKSAPAEQNLSSIADEIVVNLSDDQLKSLGLDTKNRAKAQESAKGIVRGMLVAENEQRKAVKMQNDRLQLGLIKDQADVDMAKRTIAKDVVINTIKANPNMTKEQIDALVDPIKGNAAIVASGLKAEEIQGMAQDYARAKNKEDAGIALETKVREAQIRASDAGAAENRAQAGLVSKQAANYETDIRAKRDAAAQDDRVRLESMDRKAVQDHINNLISIKTDIAKKYTNPVTGLLNKAAYDAEILAKGIDADLDAAMFRSKAVALPVSK